jgi:hypothetical protein
MTRRGSCGEVRGPAAPQARVARGPRGYPRNLRDPHLVAICVLQSLAVWLNLRSFTKSLAFSAHFS